jgi:Tol biopolymer transport system component
MGRGLTLPAVRLAFLTLLLLPAPGSAQYFGRQKVQYEDFDWQVMETPHFQIHYYPEELEATRDAARMAERWYDRLSRAFQHEFEELPLILYADHPDFQQTNVIGESISEGTGGVTEGLRTRVIMPFTGAYADDDHVLGHEMVHMFQYNMAASQASAGGLQGLSRLPLWLIEGMAEYLSLGRNDPHTAMWLRDAALRGELPTIVQLTKDSRFFPYRYGQALWAYIAGRWGDRAVTEVFRFSTRNGFEAALQRVLGISHSELSQDWITATRAAYLPSLEGRQRPEDAGDPILVDDEIGAMNLAPVVSPDGNRVAFFGRRDIFTVDLYLADAHTGEVLKRLTSPQRDQHYDALSFIQSAGTWSPDGQKFAFVVFEQGDNRLAILDVQSADVERRIEVPDVGAISNPSWSPDGRSIAFSGMQGGLSDLYVFDLETNETRQLTADRYADLQPTWSPDGSTIAFVSDRGTGTDFTNLTYGKVGLATYDVASGTVSPLTVFEGVKHINPQYSPDGRSLFFIGGRDGFSDIYRLDLASGTAYQVTRVATGVSGITALAPAMSVAAQDGRILFSVFENSGNNVYGLEAERTAGEQVQEPSPDIVAVAGTLPPVEAAGSGLVHDYLSDPETGLPPSGDYDTRDYSASIALDYLGPPSFGVGVGGYGGVGVAGGVSAFFGDMLGDHFIGTAIQANGTLKDIGGQAVYYNLGNRLNWGFGAGHIPYLTGGVRAPVHIGDGIFVQDLILQRIFVDQASLLSRYPFSTTRRVELSAGYTRYGFDREIDRYYMDQIGRIIDVERIDTASFDPLGFFEASLAYVGDNSYFGFTSPVTGQRFRFEVSPTIGSLQYLTVTADVRRYFRLQPFTLAVRGLHYGRYGRDASGISQEGVGILSPLFLGYESLVRGYDYNSFSPTECSTDQTGCPVLERLFGEKLGVASIELRIPLLGFRDAGLGLINFPFLPTEISPFVDAGVAWTGNESPVWEFASRSLERTPVFSAGVSARVNLFGYFVFETYYAYPFQRPDKGGHFGFQLMPGW